MSDKKPPSTALVLRATRELTDDDLSGMIYRSNHLFDRKRIIATYDRDEDGVMKAKDFEGVEASRSYLIYSETNRRFVGTVKSGRFMLLLQDEDRQLRLILYPMADA
jgi:hypothetical protein